MSDDLAARLAAVEERLRNIEANYTLMANEMQKLNEHFALFLAREAKGE